MCHFGSLAFFPALIFSRAFFNLQFLHVASCDLVVAGFNNRLFCFVALKQKRMSPKPSRNLMSPINPHRRSQEFINQHKPKQLALPFDTENGGSCLNFSTYARSVPENATMPSEYGGDTVSSVARLPLVLQTKLIGSLAFLPAVCLRFLLHLVPDGYIDRIWECWSHPLHNAERQSGTAAATTEEVACLCITHLVILLGGLSSERHTLPHITADGSYDGAMNK